MNNQENLNNLTDSNTDTDYESDSETYINIQDLLDQDMKNIYQIQINNEKLVVKHIGTSSHVPDIIIKEEFGKKKNLNLYSCIYTNLDIDFFKNKVDEDKFLPVIKLVEKLEDENKIYTISIKIKCLLKYDEPFTDFELFLTYSTNSKNNNYIHHIELEKDINSKNIIEKMLEKIIELGISIF